MAKKKLTDEEDKLLGEIMEDFAAEKVVDVLPERKAFTIERCNGGWEFITLTFRGERLVSEVRGETTLKAFAIEEFKKAAFRHWSSIG